MPSWCNNRLTIEGPLEDRLSFARLASRLVVDRQDLGSEFGQEQPLNSPISLDNLCPFSIDLPSEEFLDWNRENWGTKWDLCEVTKREGWDLKEEQ